MKKYLSSLFITFIFMFVGIVKVNAVNISGPSSVNVGKTATVKITDVINGNEYKLDFDSTYFEVSSTCGNRSKITSNCELDLKVLSSLKLTEDKVISFTISETASNDETKTTSLTIKANTQKPPESTKPPEETTTKPKTEAPKSNNANLKTLVIKADDDSEVALSPSFNSSVYEYSANVASTIRTISVNATMEDAKANMVISNNVNQELKAGENNKITITVTAEDGTKKAYVVNVKRDALTADATLKELTIEENKSFRLEEDKFNYIVKIKKNVKELTISYVLSDENASVSIEGNKNLKDGSKVKIIVTAEDGTKKVYTLNISKEATITKTKEKVISTERNPLIIMGLSIIAFGLIGGIVYVIRK